jgi:hypothetical protein
LIADITIRERPETPLQSFLPGEKKSIPRRGLFSVTYRGVSIYVFGGCQSSAVSCRLASRRGILVGPKTSLLFTQQIADFMCPIFTDFTAQNHIFVGNNRKYDSQSRAAAKLLTTPFMANFRLADKPSRILASTWNVLRGL